MSAVASQRDMYRILLAQQTTATTPGKSVSVVCVWAQATTPGEQATASPSNLTNTSLEWSRGTYMTYYLSKARLDLPQQTTATTPGEGGDSSSSHNPGPSKRRILSRIGVVNDLHGTCLL